MTRTHKKSLYVVLFVLTMLAALSLTSVAAGITDFEYEDGNYTGISLYVTNTDIPYDNSDGLYTITKFNIYGGMVEDEYFYLVNNQLNYYYDLLPLYQSDVTFNDSAIVTYLMNKYPTTDFTYLSDSLNTSDTYLSTLFNSIRSDYSYVSSMSYNTGYNSGFNAGRVFGYDDGYSNGKNDGYSLGLNDGLTEAGAVENGLKTIFSAPIYMLTSILDFEILGFSLYKFILSIITIFIIGFIVKNIFGLF